MKTFKSIQKNQEQLNTLLMEKWAPVKNKMEEQEEMPIDDEFEPASGASAPDINSDAMASTLDSANAPISLEEEHNCRSAHPGMNHDQWASKHR